MSSAFKVLSRCQLEDTVLLIGTLLLLDPVLFPEYKEGVTINWINNQYWSTSRGTFDKNNFTPIAYTFVGVITFSMPCKDLRRDY